MKYCEDCKYCKPSLAHRILDFGFKKNSYEFAICMHPKATRQDVDRIRRNIKPVHNYCSIMRMNSLCGYDGKLWTKI